MAFCLASLYAQVRSLRLYVGEQAQENARRFRRLEEAGPAQGRA